MESHLLAKKYNVDSASHDAAQVMYLASKILTDENKFNLLTDTESYKDVRIENPDFKGLNPLRKINLETYAYVYETVKTLTAK